MYRKQQAMAFNPSPSLTGALIGKQPIVTIGGVWLLLGVQQPLPQRACLVSGNLGRHDSSRHAVSIALWATVRK